MDVSTPPSLDLACPQAETEINKYAHMFRERGVDKTKYEHVDKTKFEQRYHRIISYAKVIIPSQSKVWIRNLIEN